tara:strand:+ start:6729 stop:7523 length:795 start_codon:yes stop_codon:yes gene_type:complete
MTKAIDIIHSKVKGIKPKVGIILGSGLGIFSEHILDKTIIKYRELPGFPDAGVDGHLGEFIIGTINNKEVILLNGRSHYYENGRADAMRVPISTLKKLGCETLVVTNAAGSIMSEAKPGSIMLLTDHINFTGVSPLFGEEGSSRFLDMVNAYDSQLLQKFRLIAQSKKLTLHEGVYIWFCGPNFETPAEIAAAKSLGANVVGMSTVPEVILARYYGIKVAAISIITNMAAGMSDFTLSHEQTIENAELATQNVQILLSEFLLNY